MPRIATVALLFSLLDSAAAAQTCKGLESFQRRPIQLFANGVFSAESRSVGAGVAVGGAGPFGEFQVGDIDVDAYSGSSFTLGGGVGYQVPLNQRATVQLCPTAEVVFARGPKNINGTGNDFSENDFSFGVAAGVRATPAARRVQVVPTGSIAFGNAHTTLSAVSGSVSSSQSFGIVRLGVGFVFGHELSVTPVVSHPFGQSGTSTTFGLTVAFTFGGARLPFIASPATSCAGVANADSVVYDTTDVTERPRLRIVPELRYPPVHRELRLEGRVIVAVVIEPDGSPDQSSLRIIQNADAAMDREALRWIRSASYWPACRAARPVRARIAQPVDFCVVGCARGKSP